MRSPLTQLRGAEPKGPDMHRAEEVEMSKHKSQGTERRESRCRTGRAQGNAGGASGVGPGRSQVS